MMSQSIKEKHQFFFDAKYWNPNTHYPHIWNGAYPYKPYRTVKPKGKKGNRIVPN